MMNEAPFARRLVLLESWLRKSVPLAFGLLIAAAAAVMLHYSFGPFRILFNSDDAAGVLYGHEMLEQGSLLPQWNNATGVMMPFIMPRLLFEPLLLLITHDWFLADRIAVAIDQALMFALVWWVLGRAGLRRTPRMFLVALLLIGPSWLFWSQSTLLAGKSWSYAFALLIVWLGWRVGEAPQLRQAQRPLAALLIFAGIIFIDVANAATLLPGLSVAFGVEVLSRHTKRPGMAALAIGGLCVAAIIGKVLFLALLRDSTYSPMAMAFVDPNASGQNLKALLLGVPLLFGALPQIGASPYSPAAAAAGVKFVIMIAALGAPFYFFLRHGRLNNGYARLLAVTCAVSLTLRAYIFLFTGISTGSFGAARYFITDILIGLTVVLFYLQQRFGSRWFCEPLVFAAILPFVATPALRDMGAPNPRTPLPLAGELLSTGVKRGYASFWNANTITVQTNGAFRMNQVLFENGTIQPYSWLSSRHWFEGHPERSLLLLEPSERGVPLPQLDRVAGPPERVVELSEGYEARIYPFDIATRMGWGRTMDEALPDIAMRSRVEATRSPSVDPKTGELILYWRVENTGDRLLTSYGRYPVNLGLHAFAAEDRMINLDLLRVQLPVLEPKTSIEIETRVSQRLLRDVTRIEADLVQEGVTWFAARGNVTGTVELPRQLFPRGDAPAGLEHSAGDGAGQLPSR